jgi:hypothetical protein
LRTQVKIAHLYELVFSNGKRYVGVSKEFNRRLRAHFRNARLGKDYSVSRAIRKYGIPKSKILVTGKRDYILDLEKKAISTWKLRDSRYGYNCTSGGDGVSGFDAAISAKISASNKKFFKEKGYTPEWRAKISAAGRGRVASPELCEKRRIAALKRWANLEFRKRTIRSIRRVMRKPEVIKVITDRLVHWRKDFKKNNPDEYKAIYTKIGIKRKGLKSSPATIRRQSFMLKWHWAQKKAAAEMRKLAAA